jgi:uncharacterized protein (DUF302 family)
MNPKGIIIRPSRYSVKETIDRLEIFLGQRGASVYTRIDQQSEMNKAGLKISPLEFILFGNPKVGGLVMLENPISALDLPLKIIAWENDKKEVWLAYNEAAYLEERYSLPHSLVVPLDLDPLITKVLTA